MPDNEKVIYDIGILGGGQLGRMLIQSLMDFGFSIAVLDEDKAAPSRDFCHHFELGSFRDYQTVLDFGRRCKRITIEIEHINVDALRVLEGEGKIVYPQPHVIAIIQDKILQKQFYKDNHFPTADYVVLSSPKESMQHTTYLPGFYKYAKGGYDGKGVMQITPTTNFVGYPLGEGVLEKEITPIKEVSVIVARDKTGEVKCYDGIDMVAYPDHNMLKYLSAPSNFASEILMRMEDIAIQVIEKLGMIGILAVEFFVDKHDQIYINEIAPRPHNSGHHTIEACYTSQYQQLARILGGFPLGNTALISPATMINLVGKEGHSGKTFYRGLDVAMGKDNVYIHLYGKEMTKPFRKMGHITILNADLKESQKVADELIEVVEV